MSKKLGSPRKPTKSRRSLSTKRLSASTPISSKGAKQALHEKLATELLIQSLSPSSAHSTQEAIVEGVSMWPVLRPGFRIRYRRVNPDNLIPGDIIVVQSASKRGGKILRVHRLVGRSGPLFLEAGDNTFSASLVTGDRILGKVESALDAKGRKVKFPSWALEESRFRFFLRGANVFMFTHELKDRFVGGKKSLLLWRISQLYRVSLGAIGLEVPALAPKS